MIKLNYCIPSLSILYQPPPPGVVSLSQALCSADDYSNSLLHLDLSKNPGVLSGEDATVRHKNCCIVCSHSNILMHTYCKKSWVEEGGEESCNIIIKIFLHLPIRKESMYMYHCMENSQASVTYTVYNILILINWKIIIFLVLLLCHLRMEM